MSTFGRGSLAPILKLLADIVWWILWGLLGLASLALVAAAATFIMDVMGYAPGNVSAVLGTIYDVGWVIPVAIAEIVAALIVVERLRRIIGTLIAGDPFVPENAGHLRVIAIVIAAYQVLRHVTQGAVAMILTMMNRSTDFAVEGGIDLGAWFAVGVLLVFAEVFREGARMRQEQKLTI